MSENSGEKESGTWTIIAVTEDEILEIRNKPDFEIGDLARRISREDPELGQYIENAVMTTADDDAARRVEEAAYIVYETLMQRNYVAEDDLDSE